MLESGSSKCIIVTIPTHACARAHMHTHTLTRTHTHEHTHIHIHHAGKTYLLIASLSCQVCLISAYVRPRRGNLLTMRDHSSFPSPTSLYRASTLPLRNCWRNTGRLVGEVREVIVDQESYM